MSLPLIDEHEAAARLGISVRTLQKGRCSGLGIVPTFVKLGRRVMYEPETLADYIAANRRTSTSDTGAGRAA